MEPKARLDMPRARPRSWAAWNEVRSWVMGSGFEIRQEEISLQAHFVRPVFGLFKDVPHLATHLFEALDSYGIRLSDLKMDSTGENLGEVSIQIALQNLVTARLFLDRIDLTSAYLPFLNDFREGAFTTDLLSSIQDYSPEISYRAFRMTHEAHGRLDLPLKDFLSRFSAAAPKTLGPTLGSGTVFYFGPAEDRLMGSLLLDFSRVVEEGLFLKISIVFDAEQVETRALLKVFGARLSSLLDELGLEMIRRVA